MLEGNQQREVQAEVQRAVRMQCVSMAMGLTNTGHQFTSNLEVAQFADLLAQYVLTGKLPKGKDQESA